MATDKPTTQFFTYGGERISYIVCYVPDRETKVAIHVHPDGSVQVDAPIDAPPGDIKKAVLKRARWVVGPYRASSGAAQACSSPAVCQRGKLLLSGKTLSTEGCCIREDQRLSKTPQRKFSSRVGRHQPHKS